MSLTRFGTVDLLESPLSADNEHQIRFNTLSDQTSAISNWHGTLVSQYNIVKLAPDLILQINIDYYEGVKKNYARIQNTDSYGNDKWYYYFIIKSEWINDKTVQFTLHLDSWQTWMFDIKFNKCFMERRHTVDYLNTLADVPQQGSLIENMSQVYPFSGAYFVFCNQDVTQDTTTSSQTYAFKMGKYSVPSMVLIFKEEEAGSLALTLQNIANAGRGDRVSAVVYVPCLGNINSLVWQQLSALGGTINVCTGSDYPEEVLKQIIEFDFSSVNLGFLKALTYPYAKIIVQDMATGQSIELQPEKFSIAGEHKISFEIQSTISESPTYKIIPLNYKGQSKAFNEALTVRCNTVLPTTNNSYAKYLMNYGDFNSLRMLNAGVGIGASALTASGLGIVSSYSSIANIMLQESQAQKQPNQLTSVTDGAQERLQFQNGIKVTLMTMDADHLASAQAFWNMYGYPSKELDYIGFIDKDWQFFKVQDANINGNIPQNDLEEISNMFKKGVTIWKETSFRNYG